MFQEGMAATQNMELSTRHNPNNLPLIRSQRLGILNAYLAVLYEAREYNSLMKIALEILMDPVFVPDSSFACQKLSNTFCISINAAIKSDDLLMVLKLWSKMDQLNISPSKANFENVLKYLQCTSMNPKVVEWFEFEVKKQVISSPQSFLFFTAYLTYLTANGLISNANKTMKYLGINWKAMFSILEQIISPPHRATLFSLIQSSLSHISVTDSHLFSSSSDANISAQSRGAIILERAINLKDYEQGLEAFIAFQKASKTQGRISKVNYTSRLASNMKHFHYADQIRGIMAFAAICFHVSPTITSEFFSNGFLLKGSGAISKELQHPAADVRQCQLLLTMAFQTRKLEFFDMACSQFFHFVYASSSNTMSDRILPASIEALA